MPKKQKNTKRKNSLALLKQRGALLQVLERVASGDTLAEACKELGINASTVRSMGVRGGRFGAAYDRARTEQLHAWADRLILDLKEAPADRDEILRARYIADNRKWLLSRLLPNVYSDKHDNTDHNVQPVVNVHVTAAPTEKLALQVEVPSTQVEVLEEPPLLEGASSDGKSSKKTEGGGI